MNTMQLMETILARISYLTDLNPGYIWTEYDWREVCQLKQEMEEYSGLVTFDE